MKRSFFFVSVATVLLFLAGTASSHAGIRVNFGVGVGFGGGYGYGYCHPEYYHHYWARPYCGSYYYGPSVYVAPAPVYVDPPVVVSSPAPVTEVASAPSIPYGFIRSGGILKSPYSGFSMELGGHSSGDIVYDANNGKPFKVP